MCRMCLPSCGALESAWRCCPMQPGKYSMPRQDSGLDGVFHHIISTDRIRSFKPDPRAYQLGPDILGLHKQEIVFVASRVGCCGCQVVWIPNVLNNRLHSVPEQLGATPDAQEPPWKSCGTSEEQPRLDQGRVLQECPATRDGRLLLCLVAAIPLSPARPEAHSACRDLSACRLRAEWRRHRYCRSRIERV